MQPLILTLTSSIVILACSGGLFALRGMYFSAKLLKYIKNKDYKSWVHITSIGRFGPGLVNNFRYRRYVNQMRDEDESIARYDDKIRIAIRYFALFLSAAIVNFCLAYYLVRRMIDG